MGIEVGCGRCEKTSLCFCAVAGIDNIRAKLAYGLGCALCIQAFVCCKDRTTQLESSTPSPSASLVKPQESISVSPALFHFPRVGFTDIDPLPDGLLEHPTRSAPFEPIAGAQDECPSDMVLVAGKYCPGLIQPCLEWVRGGVRRCARFGKSKCVGNRFLRRFCIDRYEYPNQKGVKPALMVSWYDALRACEIEGKRLCLASEWNFACEGTQGLPYPYGYARDKRFCNFERPRPSPEPYFNLFAKPRKVGAEVARLDMRIKSGRLQGCVSPFGVHDMTGNVDEWVINENHFNQPEKQERKPPPISGLKGGYWGPIRAACRPITIAHVERFRFYQVGFRCCANAKMHPDGVADRYTYQLSRWRRKAGLRPEGGPIEKAEVAQPR